MELLNSVIANVTQLVKEGILTRNQARTLLKEVFEATAGIKTKAFDGVVPSGDAGCQSQATYHYHYYGTAVPTGTWSY